MCWPRPNTAAPEPAPDGSSVTPNTSMPRDRKAEHGAARILDQIARIDHVDVGRLAVREHQDQFAMTAHRRDLGAGMAQRRSEPRRQMRFEMRQAAP